MRFLKEIRQLLSAASGRVPLPRPLLCDNPHCGKTTRSLTACEAERWAARRLVTCRRCGGWGVLRDPAEVF